MTLNMTKYLRIGLPLCVDRVLCTSKTGFFFFFLRFQQLIHKSEEEWGRTGVKIRFPFQAISFSLLSCQLFIFLICVFFIFLFLRHLISLFAGFSVRWRQYPRNITIARILKGLFLISKDITVTRAFSDNRQRYSLTKDYPFLALHIIT